DNIFFTVEFNLQVDYSRKMNLLSSFGFLLCLNYIRHLKQSGCAWFAIPCSSWVWMSMGSSMRSYLRPQGWSEKRCTQIGNRLARRLCYMLELCFRKKVFYIIEQPQSSLLFQYKPLKKLLLRHGARMGQCSLGGYFAPTLKPATHQH
ncbi:unnamed protein product, partial [Cladocopium goreaui]